MTETQIIKKKVAKRRKKRIKAIGELRAKCAKNRVKMKTAAIKCGFPVDSVYNNMNSGNISEKRIQALSDAVDEIKKDKEVNTFV